MTTDNHKNVTAERHSFTKSERVYVKSIIHNLSFQRLTDQEIVQWLHEEKQIDLDRSTVSKMRNQIDKEAEKWYIELRRSAYRYLAQYKQRIDSLLSYQKTLHEIISSTKKDEVKIRAISELHSIEMDIFSLWKQLPASDISSTVDNSENEKKGQWAVHIGEVGEEEENNDHYRHQYENENVWPHGMPRAISHGKEKDEEHDRSVYFGWKEGDAPLDGRFRAMMEEKYGVDKEPLDKEIWVACDGCKRWFKNAELLRMHYGICPEPIV